MPKVISKNPNQIKTRVEIRSLILNSGLFEVETKNGVQIPRGVYGLHQKKFSGRIVFRKKIPYFLNELTDILFSFINKSEINSEAEIKDLISDKSLIDILKTAGDFLKKK